MLIAIAAIALVVVGAALAACARPTPYPQSSVTPQPSPGWASATPGPAEATGPGAAVQPPEPHASPVFLGEACDPVRDTSPRQAVNGLLLHCVPDPDPSAGPPRWSTQPPSQTAPGIPLGEGVACRPEDVGRVLPDADGHMMVCLRDSEGVLRWSHVS